MPKSSFIHLNTWTIGHDAFSARNVYTVVSIQSNIIVNYQSKESVVDRVNLFMNPNTHMGWHRNILLPLVDQKSSLVSLDAPFYLHGLP